MSRDGFYLIGLGWENDPEGRTPGWYWKCEDGYTLWFRNEEDAYARQKEWDAEKSSVSEPVWPDHSDKAEYLVSHGWKPGATSYPLWEYEFSDPIRATYRAMSTDDAYNVQQKWVFKNADMVNSPPHYNQHNIEVIDIIETYFHDNYHLGNACKYLLRCQYKGHTEEDLQKCIWYINRFMTHEHDAVPDLPTVEGNP